MEAASSHWLGGSHCFKAALDFVFRFHYFYYYIKGGMKYIFLSCTQNNITMTFKNRTIVMYIIVNIRIIILFDYLPGFKVRNIWPTFISHLSLGITCGCPCVYPWYPRYRVSLEWA